MSTVIPPGGGEVVDRLLGMQLAIHRWGAGPKVVLIHGAAAPSRETWWAQKPLADRWSLVAVDRFGNGDSPDGRNDFLLDAKLIGEQVLTEPSHVVGYSYGSIAAMIVTARTPELVRSLVVIEPPTPQAGTPSPELAAWAREIDSFGEPTDDLAGLVGRFFRTAGVPIEVPDPLPAWLEKGAKAFAGWRAPTEARLPLDELRESGVPMIAISGAHSHYESVCDGITKRTGARREVLVGLNHLIPSLGEPFNKLLEEFWRSVEA